MTPRARSYVGLALLFVACSSGSAPSKDPCVRLFAKESSLGAFDGNHFAAESALAIGMACHELRPDDLACLDKAQTVADLQACTHADTVFIDQVDRLHRPSAVPPDSADARLWSAAVCGCKDVACLVDVGEREYDRIPRVEAATSDDPSVREGLENARACLARLAGAAR